MQVSNMKAPREAELFLKSDAKMSFRLEIEEFF